MKLSLRQQLSQFSYLLQERLLPALQLPLGPLEPTHRRLVATLELLPLERFLPVSRGWVGRPAKDRTAIARAFVAKAICGFGQTRQLLTRLRQDQALLEICGWHRPDDLPHESTFSRAFAEFALLRLPEHVHEALVRETQQQRLVGHIARDSTAIPAREHFEAPPKQSPKKKKKKEIRAKSSPQQRRYKGGKRPAKPASDTRLHRQRTQTLDQMLGELPRTCSIGVKCNGEGKCQYWRGYKLHLDVADGQIPISAVLTGASVHDSQVCIPLATMSTARVTYCYELMDSAYDAQEIRQHLAGLGHVAIIDPKYSGQRKGEKERVLPLGVPARQLSWAEADRFKERTMVERINGRLKDEFGARDIRVRGPQKVMAHLMFGLLALTADQLLRLVKPVK